MSVLSPLDDLAGRNHSGESGSLSVLFPPGFSPNSGSVELEAGEFLRDDGGSLLKQGFGVVGEASCGKVPEFKPGKSGLESCPMGLVQLRVSGRRRDDVSVFVGNLPSNVSSSWILSNFARFGEISDVYIPGYRSKNSSSGFGFVRFPDRAVAERASSVMNGFRVGSKELIVNVAKFGKNESSCRRYRSIVGGVGRPLSHVSPDDAHLKMYPVSRPLAGPRSFAQVVSGVVPAGGDLGEPNKRFKVAGSSSDIGWLSNCLMGKASRFSKLDELVEVLKKDVFGVKQVLKWGGRKLIIEFVSNDVCIEALAGLKKMKEMVDVHPWCGEMVNSERLAWIRCVCLPISGWNISTFSVIAGIWGSLVAVDARSINATDFSCARFLVETEVKTIDGVVEINIGGSSFEVGVREEFVDAGFWGRSDIGCHVDLEDRFCIAGGIVSCEAGHSNACPVGAGGLLGDLPVDQNVRSDDCHSTASPSFVPDSCGSETRVLDSQEDVPTFKGGLACSNSPNFCSFSNKSGTRLGSKKSVKAVSGITWSLNLNNKSSRSARKEVRSKQCRASAFDIPSFTDEIVNTRKVSELLGVSFKGVTDDRIRDAILQEKG